jgi:hypothetical protein
LFDEVQSDLKALYAKREEAENAQLIGLIRSKKIDYDSMIEYLKKLNKDEVIAVD